MKGEAIEIEMTGSEVDGMGGPALAVLYKGDEIYLMDKDEPRDKSPTSFVLDGIRYGLLNTSGEYYVNGDPANRITGYKAQALYNEKMARVEGSLKDDHIFLLDSDDREVTGIATNAIQDFPKFSIWKEPLATHLRPDTRPPAANVDLTRIYKAIVGNKLKERTQKGRDLYHEYMEVRFTDTIVDKNGKEGDGSKAKAAKKPYSNLKIRQLPYASISGAFKYRKEEGLIDHSGYLQVDIDNLGSASELEKIKETLLKDPHIETEMLFTSISGCGIKWIVCIDIGARSQADYVQAIGGYLMKTYRIEIDPACKDHARAMLLSYDPSCYINPKYLVS